MAIQKSRSLRNLLALQLGQPDEQKPAVVASPGPDTPIKIPDPQNLISVSAREYSKQVTPGGEQQSQVTAQTPVNTAEPSSAYTPGDVTNEVTPDELRRRKLTNPQGKLSAKF